MPCGSIDALLPGWASMGGHQWAAAGQTPGPDGAGAKPVATRLELERLTCRPKWLRCYTGLPCRRLPPLCRHLPLPPDVPQKVDGLSFGGSVTSVLRRPQRLVCRDCDGSVLPMHVGGHDVVSDDGLQQPIRKSLRF